MRNNILLTKMLAAAGTGLVWLPILAPFLITAAFFIQTRQIRFDYLMPAELFLLALAGGALLLWAALRASSRRGLIGWGLGLAAVFLFASQGLAVFTGLASGETEAAGWRLILVLAALAAYSLSVVLMGVGGALLLRDLYRKSPTPQERFSLK